MLVTSFNLAQAVKPFKMNVAGVALPYEMASAVVRTLASLAFHINSLRLSCVLQDLQKHDEQEEKEATIKAKQSYC